MFIFAQGKKSCPIRCDDKQALIQEIEKQISKYANEITNEKRIKAQTDFAAAGVYHANKEKWIVCDTCLSALDSERRREPLEECMKRLQDRLCNSKDYAWVGLSSRCYDLASRTLRLITDEHNQSLGSDEVRLGGIELEDKSGPLAFDAR